jgi:hypothetical protein
MRVFVESSGGVGPDCARTLEVSPESSNVATSRTLIRSVSFLSVLIVAVSLTTAVSVRKPSFAEPHARVHSPFQPRIERSTPLSLFEHRAESSQHPVVFHEMSLEARSSLATDPEGGVAIGR